MANGIHPDWLVPDWPVPSSVRAVCSTRAGGVSLPPYGTLNLGDHVNDDPAAVVVNRRRFAEALGAKPVFMRQVHGWDVASLPGRAGEETVADACVATASGVACTIMVADCLPVLFADEQGRAVAAAHAGWRGLAGGADGTGVIESTVASLRTALNEADGKASRLFAWLGPCIGPEAFEVGPEVKAAFEAQDTGAAACFKPHGEGKWLADLQGLARRRLQALNITQVFGNDGSAAWCTVGQPSRFFSHRRDRIGGRFAAAVWRV